MPNPNSMGHATKRGLRVPNPDSRGHKIYAGDPWSCPLPNPCPGDVQVPNGYTHGPHPILLHVSPQIIAGRLGKGRLSAVSRLLSMERCIFWAHHFATDTRYVKAIPGFKDTVDLLKCRLMDMLSDQDLIGMGQGWAGAPLNPPGGRASKAVGIYPMTRGASSAGPRT